MVSYLFQFLYYPRVTTTTMTSVANNITRFKHNDIHVLITIDISINICLTYILLILEITARLLDLNYLVS